MSQEKIIIKGAREHNLKNIDLEIPRGKLVVITGLSGSGKSSLAFDTIYAEGQRRYVESLSSYARMFLDKTDKPDIDSIDGLSPAISIDQKTTSRNPRSSVGTVTEIHDYLRLLYARIGVPHCPKCGRPVSRQSIDEIINAIRKQAKGSRLHILAPVARGRKGEYQKLLADLRQQGFARLRLDGELCELSEEIVIEKNKKHNIEVVVDRLILRDGINSRLADSLETALKLADGQAMVLVQQTEQQKYEELLFSEKLSCKYCDMSIEELQPRSFSFNNPFGACPDCTGLGFSLRVDENLLIADKNLSVRAGGLARWNTTTNGWYFRFIEAVAVKGGFSLDEPIKNLPRWVLDEIFYGCGDEKITILYETEDGTKKWSHTWEGLANNYERRYRETNSEAMRQELGKYMTAKKCQTCGGARLKPEALAVTVGDRNIWQISNLSIGECRSFFANLALSPRDLMISAKILKEIITRLDFLLNVGLDYLTLARSAASLSGGEAQRIRLATQIGSALTGVLYVLDEPSIGLHQRDNSRLIDALQNLRDLGNSVLVVEHDEETMRAADYIIDIGPNAGEHGGEVVAVGSIEDIIACERSLTGQYLSGKAVIPIPQFRRDGSGKKMVIRGARANNLKNIDVEIPLGKFICVTGVSGSGKSSLINEILYKSAARRLNRAFTTPADHDGIDGLEQLEKVINIDQSAIGRTPRSNPATYTGLFDLVRELYSLTPEARARGYKQGRFSFNVKGGRCEACQGDGIVKIEMHFLPDVYVPCEVCKGKRYNQETLEVYYKGKNIADVLNMTVDEAAAFFANQPKIARKLDTLKAVGLGYIRLGQSATTLSGGEAQRVKLSTELSRRSDGKTIYILDEPTTGLHAADIDRLLLVLNRLVEKGNTVLVIEHNLDVIKTADYIIDLGPEGGDGGGEVVALGTPEQVAANPASFTGQFLQKVLPQR